MVVEIVVINISAGSELPFESNVAVAAKLFAAEITCHGFEMWRSIEVACRYHLKILWDSVEAHERFRATDKFQRWRELVGPYFAEPPGVEHGQLVINVSTS